MGGGCLAATPDPGPNYKTHADAPACVGGAPQLARWQVRAVCSLLCGHTGIAGGGDGTAFEGLCVLMKDTGWALALLSESPLGVMAELDTPGGWLPSG